MRNRNQLFVDPKFQGLLLLRALGYWFFCLLTVALMLVVWSLVTAPSRQFYLHFSDLWFLYAPAAVASILVLPLVVIDCVRLSNRFAGPLHRLRRDMRRLAAGEIVEPIHFRDDDLWREFADEFNAVARRMELLAQTSENADALTESLPIGAAKAPQTAR